MMKRIFFFTIAFALSFCLQAQIISNQVLAACGDYFVSANNSISWTLGEPMVSSWFGTNNILTEGFQQTNVFVSSINEKQISLLSVSIYPNPSADIINVQFTETSNHIFAIKLFDLSGRHIVNEKKIVFSNPTTVSFNLSGYSSGQYLFVIMDLTNQQQQTFSVQKIK